MDILVNFGCGVLSVVRGLTKEVVKSGIVMYDVVADTLSYTTEAIQDLAAEARDEVSHGKHGKSVADKPGFDEVSLPTLVHGRANW